MNGVGFEILARTPVPKLSLNYLPPTPHRGLALVAQLDALSDWRPGGRGFNPRRGRQHSFVEIDHEILIMKYFLRSFSPIDSRRAVVSFWRKNVHNTG